MRTTILSAALALSLPASALAQTDATDLDQITVTGTRTAVTVDQSLAAVEVIDRAQIERSQAHSLPQLLRGRAGINLVNQGGLGKLTTLFMRGTESDHTLFLVDGVRMGSATSGLAALQDIPLESIERIEIVRGPRSSLYGSEAIGGVIQIFTRRRTAGANPHARVGMGSHGQLQGLGAQWEIWNLASGGMPNYDVLRVATIFGAEAIGHEKDIGTLEAGKLADLQVLDKNPLEDIKNTNTIRYVMKNGRLYEGATLTEVWPRQKPIARLWWWQGSVVGGQDKDK